MFKVTAFRLRKPATVEDNEADVAEEVVYDTEKEVIACVKNWLSLLGGYYGVWIEISKVE